MAVLPDRYRILETNQYLKDVKRLQISDGSNRYQKIKDYVYFRLKMNPHIGKNIKKLRDWIPETWRYHIGDLRLFYVIDDAKRIISIVAIERRGNSYKQLLSGKVEARMPRQNPLISK